MPSPECEVPGCTLRSQTGRSICRGHRHQRDVGKPFTPVRRLKHMTGEDSKRACGLRAAGWTVTAISKELGYNRQTISMSLLRPVSRRQVYAERSDGPFPLPAGQGRCKCLLALPCNSCLPDITDLANSRRGDAPGLTT
jgi:hypothetical protein